MQILKILVLLLSSLIFLFCKESNLRNDNTQTPTAYYIFKGAVGDRRVTMNISKLKGSHSNLFLGFYYFDDEEKPIFLKGYHSFFLKGNEIDVANTDNADLEKKAIIEYKDFISADSIVLADYYTTDCTNRFHFFKGFKGKISMNKFKGLFYNCGNKPIEFELNLDTESPLFSLNSEKLKFGKNGKNDSIEINYDLLSYMPDKTIDSLLQKNVTKKIISDSLKLIKIQTYSELFENTQKTLFGKQDIDNAIRKEYTTSIAFKDNRILSLLVSIQFEGKQSGYSFSEGININIKEKKIVRYDDIFKSNTKDFIVKLIKTKYNIEASEIFDINLDNFIMNNKGISFIYFSELDMKDNVLPGNLYFLNFDDLNCF